MRKHILAPVLAAGLMLVSAGHARAQMMMGGGMMGMGGMSMMGMGGMYGMGGMGMGGFAGKMGMGGFNGARGI